MPGTSHDRARTVAEYARRWLLRKAASVEPPTLVQYRNAVDRWIVPSVVAGADGHDRVLGDVLVRDVTRSVLRDVVAAWTTRLARDTVRTRLPPLYGLLEDAVDDGLLAANPAYDLARKVLGRQRSIAPAEKALREPELRRFFASAPAVYPELVDYWLALHRAGLRPGEGLALEWAHLFEAEGQARIAHSYSQGVYGQTKGRRMRWVDLSDDLVAALTARRERLGAGRWVFPSPRWPARQPFSYTRMLELFDAICTQAGLAAGGFTPHSFRHTWATWLAEEPDVPMKYIQQRLGHARLTTTDRYTQGARPPRNLGYVNAIDRRVRRPPLGVVPAHGDVRAPG